MTRRASLAAMGLLVLSCAPPPRTWHSPDAVTFGALRARLAARRSQYADRPWAAGVHVLVREPRSGRTFEGRGAIAIAPRRAVRMIVLGGAGNTVVDAWVSVDRWRVALPALGVAQRGGREDAAELPIGFLRWWWIDPLNGALIAATAGVDGDMWLLRTGAAVVELDTVSCPRGQGLLATRRTPAHADSVLECRSAAALRRGDFVEYTDRGRGLYVRVAVESVGTAPPDEAAFLDPDDPSGAAP